MLNPHAEAGSLTANTVATVSIANVKSMSGLWVSHYSGTAAAFVVVGDHGATPSDPTVGGDDLWVILPGLYRILPVPMTGLASDTLVIKAISSANASLYFEVLD